MLDLDEVLTDAVGPIEPSFSLDQVLHDGAKQRRVRRAWLGATRVTMVLAFVAVIAFVGTRISPEPAGVLTQVTEDASPRFVKPGPNSTALLHLPTVFDGAVVAIEDWPDDVSSYLSNDAQLWALGSSPEGDEYFLALDLVANESCFFTVWQSSNRARRPACISLFDLSRGSIASPNLGAAVVLTSHGYEGRRLDEWAASQGAEVRGGLVMARPPLTPSLLLRSLFDAQLGPQNPSRPPLTTTSLVVDGSQRSFASEPVIACIRSDRDIRVQIGLPNGTAELVAELVGDGVVRFEGGRTMVTFGNFVVDREAYGTIIFMNPDATPGQIEGVEEALRRASRSSFDFFDKPSALAEYNEMFAATGAMGAAVSEKDMPPSFRTELPIGQERAHAIEQMPGVYGVVAPERAYRLGVPEREGQKVVAGMGPDGPVLHATYQSGGETVDLTVRCGRDHLDARTVSGLELPPIESDLGPLGEGDVVGQLRIPRLDLDVEVGRGTGRGVLVRGGASYPSTTLPGLTGNAAVAINRPAGIREVERGDVLVFGTVDGGFLYEVASIRVVDDTGVEVLDDFGDHRLTLTTDEPSPTRAARLVISATLVSVPVLDPPGLTLAPRPAALE